MLASESKFPLSTLFFLTPSRKACDSFLFIKFVLLSFFLSLNWLGLLTDDSEPSSAEMVTAKSVKCLTAPSKLVFLCLGVADGVAVGVVLLEALETLLIRSVLPFPESLIKQSMIILS